MSLSEKVLRNHVALTEGEAKELTFPDTKHYVVEVHPPTGNVPATLPRFVQGIREAQTKWLGLRNTSPVTAFEITRPHPEKLTYQYVVPTKSLERKIRTHMKNQVPGTKFSRGKKGLPVRKGDTVGGAILTLGEKDWYPIRTGFKTPPANSVATALHRHAIMDTKPLIQILFRRVAGKPVKRRLKTRMAYKRIGYLRKEKEKLWGSRKPTPRERKQADAIERKAGNPRFETAVRILVIGPGDYTPNRVKEVTAGFNAFESPETGQHFTSKTVRTVRRSPMLHFAKTVSRREFRGWSLKFQATTEELAALLSLPDLEQRNIRRARP